LVLDLDDRADPDLVAARVVDDLGMVEPRAKRADARLEHSLLVLRGVVLEVLGEVAELPRLLDRGDDLGAARPLELRELAAQRLRLFRCEPLLGHGLSSSSSRRRCSSCETRSSSSSQSSRVTRPSSRKRSRSRCRVPSPTRTASPRQRPESSSSSERSSSSRGPRTAPRRSKGSRSAYGGPSGLPLPGSSMGPRLAPLTAALALRFLVA